MCVCTQTLEFMHVHVWVEAFVSVLLPFIFLSGWLNTHMPVMWVCMHTWERDRACAVLWVCVLSFWVSVCVCVCVCLCVGSGSMCVWVRGEVSFGWPWLESWRRAEVKEEICRKDTHHFPHYYFFFFFFYYVSFSHCFSFLTHSLSPPLLAPRTSTPTFLSLLLHLSFPPKTHLHHQSFTC